MQSAPHLVRATAETNPGWCLKGGGAVWWRAMHHVQDPTCTYGVFKALDGLGLLTVNDLDFISPAPVEFGLDEGRSFAETTNNFDMNQHCAEWAADQNMRLQRTTLQMSFCERSCSVHGLSPTVLAPSMHRGTNKKSRKTYNLLRLSMVLRHRRGYHVRVPVIDVEIRGSLCPADFDVVAGMNVITSKVSQDDLIRMLFRETQWQPWFADKLDRRLPRLIGVTLLAEQPSLAPWEDLLELVADFCEREHNLETAFRRAFLRNLRELGRKSSLTFQSLCEHLHIVFHASDPTNIQDDDLEAYLQFLNLLCFAVEEATRA